ncbi:MAG: hypothetical protein ACI35S_00525 [Anaeroplasma sp.]
MNKFKVILFYVLSFTWGLPMSLIGGITFLVLMCLGYKPKRFRYLYYIEIGENWGGLNLGCFFLTCKVPYEKTKRHEAGHSIQNALFGPLMPFIVTIPSAIRYWYIRVFNVATNYDSIWFEGQATKLGNRIDDIFK